MGRIDKETRVIKTSPPNPPGGGLSAFITTFEYDLLNRKRTIVYPRDPRTGTSITAKYSYSSMGATAVEVYNNTGRKDIISGVLFNEFGQMTEVTRGNGTDTHYSYDIKGGRKFDLRVISGIHRILAARLTNLVTYTVSNNQTRKLQDVSYTFKIDNSISSTLNTPDIDTNGGYLSTVRYNYKYDGLNRLVKAAGLYTKSSMPNSGTQDIVNRFESGFQYAPNGNMTGRDILDPVTHSVQESLSYAYGGSNHAVTTITSSLTGERYRMSYDAVGNMISQTGSPNPPEGGSPLNPPGGDLKTKAMEYDSYNRITKVTNPDAGNEVVGQYWYDCRQDACVQAATWMSRKRPADQAGNLTSVSFPALPTSCGSGFRVRKLAKRKVAGEDRQVEVLYPSMYFGLEKHRTTSGTEIPNTTYAVNNIYLDGVAAPGPPGLRGTWPSWPSRIAAVIPNGDARYYFTDQVDSVKVVADDNGRAVTRMEYMPYGETWFTEGDNNNAPKYNSQELDKESNLYYYNARHYDAGVARFVTADTVIDGEFDTQGWNRYAYCHNNPIRYKDPSGHWHEGLGDWMKESLAHVDKHSTKVNSNTKESPKPTMSKEENDANIQKLDKILNSKASGNDRVDFNKGFHIVMLENNFNKSQYSPGKDEFKGEYYIIKDGNILEKGIGTSKASKTPKSESGEDFNTAINANNNLRSGDYKLKGDLKKGQLDIYENDTKMKAGDRTVPSTGGKYNTQDLLLIHDARASQKWSGGTGCQVLAGFKGWAQEYSKQNESKITGEYHLRDMSKIEKKE